MLVSCKRWQNGSLCVTRIARLQLVVSWPRSPLVCKGRSSIPVPCKVYSGEYGSVTVHVVHNGVSTEHSVCRVGTNGATLTGFASISTLKPDLVISGGTAGGFKARGADIGDIFVSTACMNHDRRIPLPGYDKWGIDYIQSHPTDVLAKALGFKSGIVTTGNSLTYTKEDMEVMQEHGVAVKEMEAAAIARLCKDNKVPMFALKAVTDLVDGEHPPQEEFLANLAKSVDALVAAATKILDFVQGKSLSAL